MLGRWKWCLLPQVEDQLQVAEVSHACVQYLVGLMVTRLYLSVTMCASIRAAEEWLQGPHLCRGPCLVTLFYFNNIVVT